MKFLLLLLFIPLVVFSKAIKIDVEFRAEKDDKPSFVKNQLLANSVRFAITTELDNLKLDSKMFWNNFDNNFNEYFKKIEDNLRNKFGIKDDLEIGKEKLDKFKKALRNSKLNAKAKYGNLFNLIKSYSIRERGRKTSNPSIYFLKSIMNVNRKLLYTKYNSILNMVTYKSFEQLYLLANFRFTGDIQNDFSSSNLEEFKNILINHWKSWLEKNLGDMIPIITILGDDKFDFLTNRTDDNDQLLLKLNVVLNKLSVNKISTVRKYSLGGGFLLSNLSNNKVIAHNDFPSSNIVLPYKSKEFESSLATSIYRAFIKDFNLIGNSLKKITHNTNKELISIEGSHNIRDVMNIVELLSEKGITHRFEPVIKTISKGKTTIIVYYVGDISKFSNVINNVHGYSVRKGVILELRNNKPPYTITLEKKAL